MRWRWLFALAPVTLGGSISVWLNATNRAPLYLVTVDLGTLLFALGMLLSLLSSAAMYRQTLSDQVRQETIAAASQDRRRFVRRLDHELKNPLTAILAGLASVSVLDIDESHRPVLDRVTAQAHRLRHLVAELRKLSDLETRDIERVPVDMTELLEEAFALAQDQPTAAGRQMTLAIPRAPWPLPAVAGDRDLLFVAIYNPLDNALKFTHDGDMIELRAAEDDGGVVIEIADTGPGIPEDEIPQVWDELYRGEEAQGVPGSGLGLSLVRAIMARHGGQAAIRSRPGQGTLLTLRLPTGGG